MPTEVWPPFLKTGYRSQVEYPDRGSASRSVYEFKNDPQTFRGYRTITPMRLGKPGSAPQTADTWRLTYLAPLCYKSWHAIKRAGRGFHRSFGARGPVGRRQLRLRTHSARPRTFPRRYRVDGGDALPGAALDGEGTTH